MSARTFFFTLATLSLFLLGGYIPQARGAAATSTTLPPAYVTPTIVLAWPQNVRVPTCPTGYYLPDANSGICCQNGTYYNPGYSSPTPGTTGFGLPICGRKIYPARPDLFEAGWDALQTGVEFCKYAMVNDANTVLTRMATCANCCNDTFIDPPFSSSTQQACIASCISVIPTDIPASMTAY